MTTTTVTKPATAEDFLALAREALGSGYITAGECEVKVSNAYVAIAKILADDPDAITDLLAAHRLLVKALSREFGNWEREVGAAVAWITIASTAGCLGKPHSVAPKAARRYRGDLVR